MAVLAANDGWCAKCHQKAERGDDRISVIAAVWHGALELAAQLSTVLCLSLFSSVDHRLPPLVMSSAAPSPPVALITGGSKGIGRAIALAILQRGGNVCIVDIDPKAGAAFLAELGPLGFDAQKRALFCLCDVSDEKQFAAAFAACVKQFGYLTIVVNNAGIGQLRLCAH